MHQSLLEAIFAVPSLADERRVGYGLEVQEDSSVRAAALDLDKERHGLEQQPTVQPPNPQPPQQPPQLRAQQVNPPATGKSAKPSWKEWRRDPQRIEDCSLSLTFDRIIIESANMKIQRTA